MLNRRTCSFFRDYILDLLESDRKFLVFAHHKDMLNAICNCLTQKVKYSGNLPYGHLVTTFFCPGETPTHFLIRKPRILCLPVNKANAHILKCQILREFTTCIQPLDSIVYIFSISKLYALIEVLII